jgi:tape measure domain-containing protein
MAESTTYVIELNDKLSPGLKKAAAAAMGLDNAMSGIGKKGKQGADMAGGGLNSLITKVGLAALAYKALNAAIGFASESVKTAREFESLKNAITFASGSAEEGAKNMDFIRERSKLLGTDLRVSAEGFKTLSGAMIGTKLEGQATRDIFDGIQVASSVMGLSAEDSKGAMLALGQIMGKGKVQAEELRGQIGERIPGAFNIAARAMGMTTQQLDKALEKGEVMAEDFLPKFSNELKKTFGGGLETAVNSSQANFNRFNNMMTDLKVTLGNSLMPIINRVMTGLQNAFNFLKTNYGVIMQALQPLITHFREIGALVESFFNRLTGGATVAESLQSAFAGLQEVMKFMTPIWEKIRDILGTVFDAIIKIKVAFDGFLERFPIIGKTFRGLIYLIREGFLIIMDSAKNILGGVGDLLAGIFSGDVDQIKKGLSGLSDAFAPIEGGKRMASAFAEGFNMEMIKEPLKLKTDTGEKKHANFNDVLKSQSLVKATGAGAAGAGAGGKQSSTSVDGVKSGRPTSINISIGKLIETFNVTATNLDDINNRAKDLVAQALLSAVNNVNNIAQ